MAELEADGDIESQTHEVLSNIEALLEQAGPDKSRILSCQIFLKDIGDIGRMNSVWEAWILKGQCPSRAIVRKRLGEPPTRTRLGDAGTHRHSTDTQRSKRWKTAATQAAILQATPFFPNFEPTLTQDQLRFWSDTMREQELLTKLPLLGSAMLR